MPTPKQNMINNQLLNLLSAQNRDAFMNDCECVDVRLGEVLAEVGDEAQYIYCPATCVISCETQINSNAHILIALIGNEGMLCMNHLLDIKKISFKAVVRKSGQVWRISNQNFAEQIQHNPALETILKHYLYVSYGDAVQTAACNLYHLLEQRLARLLLMFCDKSHSNELIITQELLAQMLGVRRVGVTKAAGVLQSKNLIQYSRGHVKIENKMGLTHIACSCYQRDIERYQIMMRPQ